MLWTPSGLLLALTLSAAAHYTVVSAKDAGPGADGFCDLLGLYSFSDPNANDISNQLIGRRGYSQLAAHQLAIDHFNARDDSIATSLLDSIPKDCTVYFPESAVSSDSRESQVEDAKAILEHNYNSDWNLCGVVGDIPNKDLSTVVAAVEVPFVAYAGEDNSGKLKYITQLYGQLSDLAAHTILYLDQVLNIEYLGILNGGTKRENQLSFALEKAALPRSINVGTTNLLGAANVKGDTSQRQALYQKGLEELRDNGYRAILTFVKEEEELEDFRTAATRLGMDGDDYFYIFPLDSLSLLSFELGGQERAFLEGAAFFDWLDKFHMEGARDPFFIAWNATDIAWKQRLDAVSPSFVNMDDDFFQTTAPTRGSSLIYDAVMSLGIAACQLQNTARRNESLQRQGLPMGPPMGPPRETMSSLLSKLDFNGASGRVRLVNYRRDSSGMHIGVYNARNVNGRLQAILTSTFDQSKERLWKHRPGKSFVFKGNNLSPPPFDLVVKDQNLLSTWAIAVGLTLYTLVSFLAFLFFVLVAWMKNDVTIMASQPTYSMLLCIACLVTVQAIVPLSIDESMTDNSKVLDASCRATLWLFFIGLIMCYTLLFCKMWRLDRVMQFRRGLKIREVETMWPLAVMLFLTISILITWTVVDPWHWEREFVSFNPPTTYGRCESNNFLAWVIPLCFIMLGSVLLALFAAWRTKHIANNFSDTSAVFYSITLQAQAWLVGLPTLVLLSGVSSGADAVYFGRIIFVAVLSGSPLLLVLGPRIWIAIRIRISPTYAVRALRRGSTRVSGVSKPSTEEEKDASLPIPCFNSSQE